MIISIATIQDVPELQELQHKAFGPLCIELGWDDAPTMTESLEQAYEEFAQYTTLKVQDNEGRIIGSIRGNVTDGSLYMGRLMVLPEYQRQGIGKQLFLEIQRLLPHNRAWLCTCKEVMEPYEFYLREGFRPFKNEIVGPGLTWVYMEKSKMIIKDAKETDAKAIREIYAPYVELTAITFEYDVPSEEEFRKRIETVMRKYPWIVAEEDGKIVGYAYASAFKARDAYQWAVETSIYVDNSMKRCGIGRKLHDALEQRLKAQGILNMNACISFIEPEDEYLTLDSVRFHEQLGYRRVAHFHQCGKKFGRWYDMIWMEKLIGEHI